MHFLHKKNLKPNDEKANCLQNRYALRNWLRVVSQRATLTITSQRGNAWQRSYVGLRRLVEGNMRFPCVILENQ